MTGKRAMHCVVVQGNVDSAINLDPEHVTVVIVLMVRQDMNTNIILDIINVVKTLRLQLL